MPPLSPPKGCSASLCLIPFVGLKTPWILMCAAGQYLSGHISEAHGSWLSLEMFRTSVESLVKSQCELNCLRWLTTAPKFHWDSHHWVFWVVSSAKKSNSFTSLMFSFDWTCCQSRYMFIRYRTTVGFLCTFTSFLTQLNGWFYDCSAI